MKQIKQLLARDTWIKPFFKQRPLSLWGAIILTVLTAVAGGGLMFISGYLISRSAQRPDNILLVYVPIVLTRGFGIFRPVFRYLQRLVAHNWVLRVVSVSRKRLYQSAEATAHSLRSKLQIGDLLSLLADDLDHLQNLYLRTIFPAVASWLLFAVLMLLLGWVDWRLMLVWLVLLTFVAVLLPIIGLLANRAGVQRQKALQNRLYREATDAILGLQDWLLSGRQADLVAKEGTVMADLAQAKSAGQRFGWWRDFGVQVVMLLGAVLTLWWGSATLGHDKATQTFIAAFVLTIFPLVDTWLGVNQGLSEASYYEDSIVRLNDLPEVETQPAPASLGVHGDIDFTAVTFGYDKPLFQQLDWHIATGEKIALLGRSGAGKTTLLKLLMGDLTAQSGAITIGGVQQKPTADDIAILDQNAYLFDTTIANNVRLGDLNATDEQLNEALDKAGLRALIASLPDGLQTNMREAGTRFSGGEQQRFALARVLLQGAPIVILDEPTVSLDPATERAVLATMFAALADRTVIWVTHHLTGIELVDQVYFLENGQFTMADSPANLAAKSAHFQNLLALDDF
ncbi:MAG TPA: thiol reductant ABC exporter subunit CydC [Lactobacillaceae bacterium]